MSSFEQPGFQSSREGENGFARSSEPVFPAASTRPFDPSGFTRHSFADQLSIETPEQVALQFPVAGIGSRFVAVLLDSLIQVGVVIAGLLIFALVEAGLGARTRESLGGKWLVAGLIFAFFLLFWGYFSLFEAFWRGQTPGKRAMKIRVIKDAGRQITLFESLARNLLRVADYFPGMYLVGVITMLCNKRNKRLGDLAAGTMVVHERGDAQPVFYTGGAQREMPRLFAPNGLSRTPPAVPAWNSSGEVASIFPADAIARLSSQDLVVLETFFARALDLPLETRAAMACRIVREMTAKMGLQPPDGNPERVMEAMAGELRSGGRILRQK